MDTLLNWAFLILFPLFFILFIASIIFLIVRHFKTKSKLQNWAEEQGWSYFLKYQNQEELSQFYTMVKKSVVKTSGNTTVKIENIMNGKYKGDEFWFAFYRGFSGYSGSNNTRKSTAFNIFIIPVEGLNLELTLIYRSKMIKFLHIDKMAKLLGMPLFVPDENELDWLLLTDVEKFKSLKLSNYKLDSLKEVLSDAHSILLSSGFLVYAIEYNMTLKKDRIAHYLDKLEQVQKIFTK